MLMNDFIKNSISHFVNSTYDQKIIDDANKNRKCCWNMQGACEGNIYAIETFGKQITVLVCENHFMMHIMIMALYAFEKNVEDSVKANANELLSIFEQTFGTKDINKSIFLKLIEKKGHVGDLQNITDEEMFKEMGCII